MNLFTIVLAVFVTVLSQTSTVNSQFEQAYPLFQMPSYVILAPKQVRPGTFYQASVSLIKMFYPSFTLRLTIKQNNYEYAHETVTFKNEGSQIVRVEVPTRAIPGGQYYLEIMGSVTPNSAIIFTNQTKLIFNPKEYSIFIQMSKPVYHQGQTVQFRVIPVQQNLMPKFGTVSKIQVLDPNGFIVKRWLNPTTNVGGMYEMQFPLADQIPIGTWRVEFDAEKWKANETFRVEEFWLPRFDVNVSVPVRLSALGYGILGIVSANKTSGMPVTGSCNLTVQIREPKLDRFTTEPLISITRNIRYFEGKADFLITMSELQSQIKLGSLNNKDVWINATVYDRFTQITRQGWAYTFIYSDLPRIKLFGGAARPFKPNMTFTAYLAVYQPDGTPVKNINNRNVDLEVRCGADSAKHSAKGLIVPDSGIIRHTFVLESSTCLAYELRAIYGEVGGRELSSATQFLFEYKSLSKAYLQITLATQAPRVNEFTVFHLRMTYPTNKLYIQVVAGGNIVYVDQMIMEKAVTTRTFSLAMSREMAPTARLVAYYIKSDGEIISDSLSFFVNITNLNNVKVGVNRGKDLNVDTLEINGYAEPGSYLALNVLHYDLYRRGSPNILRDYNIIDRMMEYESSSQRPYQHDWYYDLEYIDRSYVPAPSTGTDTNSTIDSSGLIMFTDASFIKTNFFHNCNGTANEAERYPCYVERGKMCYSEAERCDGVAHCVTWADEAGCPEKNTKIAGEQPKDMMENFQMLYRHWNDGAWLWKTYWVKPNGRINFRVNLPKMDTSWVVGAFAIDRAKGFSIIERPAVFSGIRRFYMVAEAPEESFYGEQIGVRLTLFNYWDYWTEALIEVKRSKDYKIVQVAEYGRVSSYSPETIHDKAVHTMVYLTAGEIKYIFIPIIPNGPGNSTIHMCAYTFIGSNCESLEFKVTMNGVANYYHTSNLVDLTSKTNINTWFFKIPLRQSFYEPEQRNLRWVPDSKSARVTVNGDVLGPTPSGKMPYFSTYEGLRMSHGALENIFFEFGFNVQFLVYLRREQKTSHVYTETILNYCNKILQDCLSYYDKNSGGFSNFREDMKPNALATAFALWNLNSVNRYLLDWDRYIYVPKELINNNIQYLRKVQIRDGILSGSFPLDGILDEKFIPTNISTKLSAEEIDAQKRVAITAMVLVALKEYKSDLSAPIEDLCITFLNRHLLKTHDVFTQLLGTYSLIVSESSGSVIVEMMNKINQNAKSNNENKYFSNSRVIEQQLEQSNAGQIHLYPRREWPNDGYTVSCSSLGMMIMNDREIWKESSVENINMVQFLTKMRNHVNAFASTFDSMMAMRALNQFARKDRNRQWYKLLITQTLTSNINWQRKFYIENFNYSVGNSTIIPNDEVHGFVIFDTLGTGRVLMQLDTTSRHFDYAYVKNPVNPEQPDTPLHSFELFCMPRYSGKNASIITMDVCANWRGNTGPLAKPQAGMVVLDVTVPTGYIVLNDELRRYVESGIVPTLKYARFWPGKINFYLENLLPTNTCVTFRADRYFPVANITRDQLCSAYEYYEPGRYNRSIFKVEALYTNHICNVFGSYQCPFSPFFNGASTTFTSTTLLLLVALVALLYRYWLITDISYPSSNPIDCQPHHHSFLNNIDYNFV